MSLDRKAVAVIGGIAGVVGLGWLVSKALAKPPTVPVALTSNPIRTVMLIDDKFEVATPKTIHLTGGTHKFKASMKSPDLLLTYQIDKWVVNGKTVATDTDTLTIEIKKPTTIRLDYMLADSGVSPILTIPQQKP